MTLEAGAPVLLASVSEESDDAIRVLLIEDGVIDRGFLTDELSKQDFAVRTVASLPAAACDADVIVLHCGRVNNSRIELVGKLHRLGFNVPVVLLTGEAAPAHECLALDKGAIDVILKSRGPEVLAKRLKGVVKTIARTDRSRSGGPVKCGKLLLRPDISRAYWKGIDVGLTLGEYKIVHLIASNAGRYVTYRAIYDRLHYEGFRRGKRRRRLSDERAIGDQAHPEPLSSARSDLRRDRKLPRLRVLLEASLKPLVSNRRLSHSLKPSVPCDFKVLR